MADPWQWGPLLHRTKFAAGDLHWNVRSQGTTQMHTVVTVISGGLRQ